MTPPSSEGSSSIPDPAARATGGGRKIDMVSDRLDSRDLFVGTREITIGHAGETYRLRLTSQNKLILTK